MAERPGGPAPMGPQSMAQRSGTQPGSAARPARNGRRPRPGLPFSLRDIVSRLVVTLSLEGTTMRVLGCRSGRVEFWLSVPFDSSLLKDGFVADPLSMGQTIANAFRHRNLPTRHVICAVPAYGSSIRSFRIPRIAGHLESVVPREARRLMGSGTDAMHLSWQSLGTQGGQEQIFAAATPRRPLEVMAEALQLAGIPPSVMELKPLALARAANQPNAIVLNAECNSVDVVVVRDGVPRAIRSLYCEAEAEELLASLMAEATAAVDQVKQEMSLPADSKLFLTGDLASREGMAYLVESWMGQPPSPLAPPLGMPKEFPVARFAVNVGLALREM